MSRPTIEERLSALEKQVGALVADQAAPRRTKDWRRTRGAFTGDDLMKRVFEEGRKIRASEAAPSSGRSRKKRPALS